MRIETIFPYTVAVMEFGAGLTYLGTGNLRLGICWLAYGVAALALGGI